jgi:hypothetical protein
MGSVRSTDSGMKKFLRFMKRAQAMQVRVGLHGEEGAETHEGSNLTISAIAAFHEFGYGVPRRSFLGDWFDQNVDRNQQIISTIYKQAIHGQDYEPEFLRQIGAVFVGDVQRRISMGLVTPPLSAARIKAKGSSIPLIHTGQLRSSLRYTFKAQGSAWEKGEAS